MESINNEHDVVRGVTLLGKGAISTAKIFRLRKGAEMGGRLLGRGATGLSRKAYRRFKKLHKDEFELFDDDDNK